MVYRGLSRSEMGSRDGEALWVVSFVVLEVSERVERWGDGVVGGLWGRG